MDGVLMECVYCGQQFSTIEEQHAHIPCSHQPVVHLSTRKRRNRRPE